MTQDPGPLDVAEEPVAQAPPLAGPLDQARDVGHDELVLVEDGPRRGEAPGW